MANERSIVHPSGAVGAVPTFPAGEGPPRVALVEHPDPLCRMRAMVALQRGDQENAYELREARAPSLVDAVLGWTASEAVVCRADDYAVSNTVMYFDLPDDIAPGAITQKLGQLLRGEVDGFYGVTTGQNAYHNAHWAFEALRKAAGNPPIVITRHRRTGGGDLLKSAQQTCAVEAALETVDDQPTLIASLTGGGKGLPPSKQTGGADVLYTKQASRQEWKAYVFLRRQGGNGLGHVAVAYQTTLDKYSCGGIENYSNNTLGSIAVLPGNRNDGWFLNDLTLLQVKQLMYKGRGRSQEGMLEPDGPAISVRRGGNTDLVEVAPYYEFKVFTISGTPNFYNAETVLRNFPKRGYLAARNNCADATIQVLQGYGVRSLPTLSTFPLPMVWFDLLNAPYGSLSER